MTTTSLHHKARLCVCVCVVHTHNDLHVSGLRAQNAFFLYFYSEGGVIKGKQS